MSQPSELASAWESGDIDRISQVQYDPKLAVKGDKLAQWEVYPWSQNTSPWFLELRCKMILTFGLKLPIFMTRNLHGGFIGTKITIIEVLHGYKPHFSPQVTLSLKPKAKANLEAVYHWCSAESYSLLQAKMGESE